MYKGGKVVFLGFEDMGFGSGEKRPVLGYLFPAYGWGVEVMENPVNKALAISLGVKKCHRPDEIEQLGVTFP